MGAGGSDQLGGPGQRLGGELADLVRQSLANPARGRGLQPVELILVMSLQRRGRIRLFELSHEAGIPPSTMTAIVDRLEKANLVRLRRGRVNMVIEATPTGAALADAVEASLMRHLPVGQRAPSPEFVSGVTQDLERIIRVLDQSPPPSTETAHADFET